MAPQVVAIRVIPGDETVLAAERAQGAATQFERAASEPADDEARACAVERDAVAPFRVGSAVVFAPRVCVGGIRFEHDDVGSTVADDGTATKIDRAEELPGRCLLYTSDAADERSSVDLGGRR